MTPLGLIAGGGDLPRRILAAAAARGRPVFIVALEGQTPPALVDGLPHLWTPLGPVVTVLERLKAEGVEEVVLAGHVRRPALSELKLDWRSTKILAKLGIKAFGDDGLLKGVRGLLEDEGFRLLSPADLVGDMTIAAGALGRHAPDAEAQIDIARGVAVVRGLGALDIGQAAVVQGGLVLGVEAAEGTEALIARCGPLGRGGAAPVLIKLRKPGQDTAIDLPAIGPATIAQLKAAGLRGVAVEAGGTLLIDRDHVRDLADEAGIFIWGIA